MWFGNLLVRNRCGISRPVISYSWFCASHALRSAVCSIFGSTATRAENSGQQQRLTSCNVKRPRTKDSTPTRCKFLIGIESAGAPFKLSHICDVCCARSRGSTLKPLFPRLETAYLECMATISSIGMNMAMTMPPITKPMSTMTTGSMIDVKPLTAVSTSLS
jgi:hypothetical protein